MIRTKKIEAIAEILYMQNENRFETMKINNRALTVAYRIAIRWKFDAGVSRRSFKIDYIVRELSRFILYVLNF